MEPKQILGFFTFSVFLKHLQFLSLLLQSHHNILVHAPISMMNRINKRLRSMSQRPVRSSVGRVSETCNSTDMEMEAFYASLVGDQNNQPNNDASSEETQKAIKKLQGLLSQKFPLLLHPGRSIVMKDTLKYLLTLPPGEEGFSMNAKSVMLQLSQSFPHWSLDYDNATLKLKTTTTTLSRAQKMKGDLEANVQEFQEMEKNEKCLSDELDQLLEEKRALEKKIIAVKTKIAKCTQKRDNVAEKKVKLFHQGRVVKAELDDLKNHAPKLKAEHECAKITQANIEAEWSRLGAQFNRCVGLEKWI